MPRSLGASTSRVSRCSAPGRRPSSCVSNTRGLRWSRRAFKAILLSVFGARGKYCPAVFRAGLTADVHATEEPGYWTFRSGPNPQSAALLVAAQLLRADHGGVEETRLVERVRLGLGVSLV